jgi:hypothetical protein
VADGHEHRYSDAANRCSDIVRTHIVMGNAGRWLAIRLSDGGSDGRVYDLRRDAIRFQLHENLCAYVCIPPDNMSPKDAHAFLALHRKLYDAGMRLSDPQVEVHAPVLTYDALLRGGLLRDRRYR